MPKSTTYKSLEIIVTSYVVLIKNKNNFHKQLKEVLISLYTHSFIKENVASLDIRKVKNKEILVDIANNFIKAPVISKLKLIDRGWTNNLINKYAGEADLIIPNPQFKDAPYLHLYSLCRIEFLEEKQEVRNQLKKTSLDKSTLISKNIDITEWIAKLEIVIPNLPINILIKNSIESYNNKIIKNFEDARSFYTKAHTLEHLCLNYLRHECTEYETRLTDLNCVTGCKEAYTKLREHINKQIYITYPNLKSQIYQYQLANNYIIENKPKVLAKV